MLGKVLKITEKAHKDIMVLASNREMADGYIKEQLEKYITLNFEYSLDNLLLKYEVTKVEDRKGLYTYTVEETAIYRISLLQRETEVLNADILEIDNSKKLYESKKTIEILEEFETNLEDIAGDLVDDDTIEIDLDTFLVEIERDTFQNIIDIKMNRNFFKEGFYASFEKLDRHNFERIKELILK